jgi:hypothetical protein
VQVKPPDVTGAQLHQDHRPESPSMRRLHRQDSFDSSFADDQYHTLLQLQRRNSPGSSRFGSGGDLIANGRSPRDAARTSALLQENGSGGSAANGADGGKREMELRGVAAAGSALGAPRVPPRAIVNIDSTSSTARASATALTAAPAQPSGARLAPAPVWGQSPSSSQGAGTAAGSSLPAISDAAGAIAGAAQRVPVIAAAAQGVGAVTADMGAKVMNAAHSIAQMTDFEGHAVKASGAASSSADGPLGEAMYERFKQFDSKYLQPMFGKGNRAFRTSAELPDGDTREGQDHDAHSQPPPG